MFALKRSPETPDRDLIQEVLDGSEVAFAELVDRYKDRVLRLLSRYCRDAIECEDLAQDVFLKVFRKLHTFQHGSQFFTWLYRITVNAATDHLSRAGSRRLKLVEDTGVFERGCDAESPTAPLEAQELAAVTRKIVEGLPEKFRTILVLREFEDLSYTEIAEVLQIQLGTVESRLFRARQRFKDALTREHPELLPNGDVAGATRGAKR
ncbi:MAG: sigma-70 family RNA polymerase sigma factor [Planctomycetes bacterium]|nr:sigma-70 family RNA polymerase sigma factor [Planctomycetota bacterium]